MRHDMRDNPGHLPADAVVLDPDTGARVRYHRVHVRLRNGWTSHNTGPWPAAGTQPPTRWSLVGHPFDIVTWEPAD